MDDPTTSLDAYEIIKKLLYPDATAEELAMIWPYIVVCKLQSVLEDLKKAQPVMQATWRKNTYAG